MSKKFRNINLCLCAAIILATISILQVRLLAKAYIGIATLTERQLYKETNTYDVDTNFFNIDGSFRTTTDNSRIMNTTQYNINYDMSTKQRIPIMEYAQITVLTHGLDSDARVWSNNFSASNKAIGFEYDNSSLITKISDQVGGANIYWAKMTGYNIFDLYNITNQKGAYSSTKPYKVENIVDISKHIIIIFESNWYNNSIGNYVSLESNDNVYYQFNYMLSKIIYDVKVANGGILPKVNLIGHSRGGITNLQYALDHPDLVSTLVSLGAPYFGSTTARLFGETLMGGQSDGLNDILDADIYYDYNTRWNNNYNTLYKDIKAYAIGSYHTLSSLTDVVNNDHSGYISSHVAPELVVAGLGLLNDIKISSLVSFVPEKVILSRVTEILGYFYPESKIVDVAEIILQELNYDKYPMFVSWYNDILVPLDSQLGNDSGSASHANSGSYIGFNKITRPFLMNDESVDYEKVSQVMPPVGHNLEARDEIIIGKILDVLDLGVNNDSAYVTAENEDGTLTFVRYRGTYSDSVFIVPESIDGVTVTAINSWAFDGENNVTEVRLPKTIKKIGSYAFAGLENLTTITFAENGQPQLEYIGPEAFLGCVNLSRFNSIVMGELSLPNSVEKVWGHSFYNTAFSEINIGSNVSYIVETAFANMKNLKKITISSSNAYYMVQDNVLYGKNGALMQYPIGSEATSFSVPATVSGVTIKHIDSHAFFNAKNLREVSLNNVMTIGLYAFTGCTNLTTLTNASNVELVLDCAFDGTPIANQEQDFITIGKVLYKYNGTHSVLESSDFPTGLERINVSAFCNKENLTEVHLPLSIYVIDNGAFVNCPNLEKMVFLNGVLPKVGEFSFTGVPDSFKFYCRKSLIDRVDSSSTWYSQLYRLEPIATRVYFEDIDLYETFYYGDYITPPKDKIEGKYNKGWLRVDEETNQTYGNYLTPIQWRETVATATYRADLILLSSYAIGVFNGEKQIGAVHISIGDRYEFKKTECIINDVTYTFANPAAMSNCYHNGYYGPSVVNGTTIAYFNGWTLFGNKISSGQWFEYYNDGVLFIYSDWDVVEFTATAYDGYSGGYSTYKFNYCDGLNLADPVRSGYKFKGWKNNNTNTIVSMPLRVESNVSLTAQWVRVYSISYQNLTFQGKTADVVLGDRATDEVREYEYGKGLDMSNVFAAWRSGSPYSPQLRFLGWFTDKNLTTPATNISATATGAKTFYAKWRFDQTNSSRHGTYSINNSDPLNQNRDQMYVGLNNNNLGNDLKALGIKTLVVKFWIKIKGTGTASIYLYNGNTKIQTQTISGFSNDEYSVKECKFVVSLSAIENAKFLDIRYQASTSGWWIFSSSDNWQSESIYYEQCYVVNESDLNSPDFFWHYQFPY